MKILGLDLDGVVYPWQEAAYIHLRDYHNYKGTYEDLFATNDFWGNQTQIFKDNFVRIEPLYYKFPPSFKTQQVMQRLAKKRDIVYITYRSEDLTHVTYKFLKNFDYPNFNNVIFSKDKKVDVRMANCNEFVDDRWEIVESLKNICDTYLMAQPWNENHRAGLKVIHSLEELERILK